MSVNYLYKTISGRFVMKILMKTGAFKLVAWYLKRRISKPMINRYIRKNNIDMSDIVEQDFSSFAEFFSRTKLIRLYEKNPDVFISPCDGLLSAYEISDNLIIPMKGSHYRFTDLVPGEKIAEKFEDGLCLVFRLQASDYHHFCAVDDAELGPVHYIPGELHSVQPIACDTFPVFRLNRRWWHLLETKNFGSIVQIEIGAMAVGGVSFNNNCASIKKGMEMGNFELAGSTIVLMLTSEIKKHLSFYDKFEEINEKGNEVPVCIGEGIGIVKNEK